ncbi:hypothetical protein RvY_03774-2 [Ramazzottius varieornatus]|uniref:Uncharacterized protein n=1 Tax=Ramazzottius varieornatus TaxID=947166 RepID=A0A1D1USP4_RAMVA|nr:hypothetical protein RvY_03774-2 [Ramazzottius varieornatus]
MIGAWAMLYGLFAVDWVHGITVLEPSKNESRTEVLILIYGMHYSTFQLQALSFTAPGFEAGVRLVNRQYDSSLSFRTVYVENSSVLRCEDTGAYFDNVSEFYYRHRTPSQIIVLFYCGCDANPIFGQLGREWDMLVVNTGSVHSSLRDRTSSPSTIALGPLQFEIYGSTTRLILEKFGWTSIAYVYDTSGRLPFHSLVFQRIRLHLKETVPHIQLVPFRANASEIRQAPYSSILRQITKFTRSNPIVRYVQALLVASS